jgi:hypothetical protein
MTATAAETVAERLEGKRPSRLRALFVAGTAAIAAGVVVYKVLRSGGESSGLGAPGPALSAQA